MPKFFGGLCNCEPYGCLFSNEGPWNENKIITEGDKRRGKNYLDILNKKKEKENMEYEEDLEEEEEEEDIGEKNHIEILDKNIINNDINKSEVLNGPNDIDI